MFPNICLYHILITLIQLYLREKNMACVETSSTVKWLKFFTQWYTNIARGTTDPGYWLFNLSYLSIVFSTCIVFVFPRYLSIYILYLCLFCICQWWRHDPWQVGWPGGGWHSLDTTAARMTMMMMMMMLVMIMMTSPFYPLSSILSNLLPLLSTFIHFHFLDHFFRHFLGSWFFGIMTREYLVT